MQYIVELKFKPILSTVPDECAKLEEILIEKNVNPDVAYKSRCIAHEVLVNAVRHGQIKDINSEITLIIKNEKELIILEFIDCGMEWQPNNDLIQKPDHYSTDEELYAPFGKGLRLIGSMCRSYDLFRCNGKNHTSISVGLK